MNENMNPNNVENENKVETENKVEVGVEKKKTSERKFDKGIIKIIILGIVFVVCLVLGIIKMSDIYKEMNFYVPEKNENEKREELSQNDMTKKLYGNIYKGTIDSLGRDERIYLYGDKKITIENVPSLYLYLAVTSNMKFEDVKMTLIPEMPDESMVPSEDGSFNVTTQAKASYSIDLKLFKDTVKKLYGSFVFTPKIRLTEEDYKEVNGLGLVCQSADNDYIYCDKKVTTENKDKIYGYVTKVEESQSYIYIYEKVVYVDVKDNVADIYSGNNKIIGDYDITEFENKTDEEIVKSIDGGKVRTYMHTFKKDGNNTYWLSVEPIA